MPLDYVCQRFYWLIVGSCMLVVENNPFRIIGVLANAKEKDIHRQKVKISKFASVGKRIKSEYDYDFLPSIERTEKSVKDAFSSIDQRQDKLEHSLFWLVNCNQFDEIALTHLSESNQEKAISTWAKVVDGREVTPKFTSCLNNYSTLQLCSPSSESLSSGIANKLKLIQSNAFPTFVGAVTDESFVVDSEKQSQKFINRIIKLFLESHKTESEIVSYFSLCDSWVKNYVAHSFCENLIFEVERSVELTQKQRSQSSDEAFTLAVTLRKNTISKLNRISALLGTNDIKFRTISDSVAQEIMRCDIAYFNAWNETRHVFDESLELLGYAKDFATSDKTKHEIESSKDDMLKRKENLRVRKYYDEIYEELENFSNRFASIENVTALINTCKPKLNTFISNTGKTEDFTFISSIVVTAALNAIIEKVNSVQEGNHTNDTILRTFRSACTAMNALSEFTMNAETQARFNTNHKTIKELYGQVSTWQSKQQGCYIATMAYGDYDHPQVIRLRQFRDYTLAKSSIGRTFIKFYYKHSPATGTKIRKQALNQQNCKIVFR